MPIREHCRLQTLHSHNLFAVAERGKEMGENGSRRPHIAILPTPGMGHLIPISEFAKLLVDRHHFTVTIIVFSESVNKAQDAFISSLPSSIATLTLPPILLSDLPPESRIETLISVAASRAVPSLRSLLLTLQSSTNLVAFVTDLFGSPSSDAAKSLSIPRYTFIPTNLHYLTLMFQLPFLHAANDCNFWELTDPVRLPGCTPIPGPDILHPLQDRKNEVYNWMLEHAKLYREARGILVNTFDAIEPEAAKLLKAEEIGRPVVYTLGPLVRDRAAAGEEGAECLRWLDMQPEGSVLFVSFGSAGTLSTEQLWELALGLEGSGQRFLWVVRSPSDWDASSTYFTVRSTDDPLKHLPEGFLDRTRDVGLAVASWAPQVEVLGHASTGGFLSHCGWNSTLESVARGVPMIAWPLFAEQRMNSVILVEGVKVALRPKARDDGVFDRKEIARVVRELMEGEEGLGVKRKAKELKAAAAEAMAEGGSSSKSLDAIAGEWKSYAVG